MTDKHIHPSAEEFARASAWIQLEVIKRRYVHAAPIPEQLRTGAWLIVLRVRADNSQDEIRQYFPSSVYTIAVENYKGVIQPSTPYVPLRATGSPPGLAQGIYFELDRSSPHFERLLRSSAIVVVLGSDRWMNLLIEVWATQREANTPTAA